MFHARKITETATSTAASSNLSMGEQLKARLLAQRRKKMKRKAAAHKGISSFFLSVLLPIRGSKLC